MALLYCDLETFSTVDIECGTHAYAEQAEILLFPYALDDEEPKCWDATSGEPMPEDLASALQDQNVLTVWHNGGMFDLTILKHVLPNGMALPHNRVFDTMACAYAHSLPGALDTLCTVLGVHEDKAKHKAGKQLIQLFCKPRPKNQKLRRATRETHPEEWQRFIEYAKGDIQATREVYKKIPKWNYQGEEYQLWLLDQRINSRGVAVDLALARGAVRAAGKAKEQLANRSAILTKGAVASTTQRDALLGHVLEAYGVHLPDMQMDTLERRIADPNLPEQLKELLSVRLQATSTSVKKYETLLKAVSSDGRLRGLLQFCGAGRTGRWSGRVFQPQNLPRPSMKQRDIDFAIDVIKADAADLLYDNVMSVLSNCIRGAIVAPGGRKLVVADLSNIEGRVAAWLAGEEWKLTAFEEFDDGIGSDLYCVAYGKAFGVDPKTVNKQERQIGKVCLAKGTQVLVHSGWKPIEEVTLEDKVWDGVEWVQHKGLLSQGMKPVIALASLYLTRDHLVLCGTRWREAQQLLEKSTGLLQALATAAGLSPSPAISSARLAASSQCLQNATVEPQSTVLPQTTSGRGAVVAALNAVEKTRGRDGGLTLEQCQRQSIACAFSTDWRQRACAARLKRTLDGATTEGAVLPSATCGLQIVHPFWNTSERLMGGITQSWRWIARILTKATNLAISGLLPSTRTTSTGERFASYNSKSIGYELKMPTYDLACAGPRRRFMVLTSEGPLLVHNCELMLQYQGRVGAFVTGAATYGINLEALAVEAKKTVPEGAWATSGGFLKWCIEKKMPTYGLSDSAFVACDSLASLWRAAHPMIASYWKELQDAFVQAVQSPGVAFHARKVSLRREGAWLKVKLPSGRFLCYPSPKVSEDGTCSYMGLDQYTRKWQRQATYGGKLLENITQAVARDVMAHAMPLAEEEGYRILLTVHDELITETPDEVEFNAEGLSGIMARQPDWAEGLPLAAAGFEAYRYRKD